MGPSAILYITSNSINLNEAENKAISHLPRKADSSHNSNTTFTFDPPKQDKTETMAVEESKLRPPRPWPDVPKIEVESKYKDMILKIPAEPHQKLRHYKGFWFRDRMLSGFLKMQEVFEPHPSDIIVTSFPKSGTTWLQNLVFTVVHRSKYDISNHPLLKLSSSTCVPYLERAYALQDEQHLETIPSPRVLRTHAPYSVLPESIKTLNCRIIYICRETKDVAVSFWHMIQLIGLPTARVPFPQFFEFFCDGRVPHGPIWDHVLEYHKASLQNPEKIMFLKYEEMMNDPIDGVIKLANFVGVPFSEEEVRKGVVEEIVNLCSFDKQKNLDVNQKKDDGTTNHILFRKAVIGDWQNHITPEMAAKLDEIITEKFHGSGISY